MRCFTVIDLAYTHDAIVVTQTQGNNCRTINIWTIVCHYCANQCFQFLCYACWCFYKLIEFMVDKKIFNYFMRWLNEIVYIHIPKEKCFHRNVVNFLQHIGEIFVKVFLQIVWCIRGLYMHPTRKFFPLKTSISVQIHSISPVSRSVHLFHLRSSDRYIATPPPSPVCQFLCMNLNPCMLNMPVFVDLMCVSDNVKISFWLINKVCNISFFQINL